MGVGDNPSTAFNPGPQSSGFYQTVPTGGVSRSQVIGHSSGENETGAETKVIGRGAAEPGESQPSSGGGESEPTTFPRRRWRRGLKIAEMLAGFSLN